ncbi:hypothetical protein CBL_02902, partial [Carabus blaptoides fortunei]
MLLNTVAAAANFKVNYTISNKPADWENEMSTGVRASWLRFFKNQNNKRMKRILNKLMFCDDEPACLEIVAGNRDYAYAMSGLIQLWFRQFAMKRKMYSTTRSESEQKLSLDNVQGPFFILGCGLMIATFEDGTPMELRCSICLPRKRRYALTCGHTFCRAHALK